MFIIESVKNLSWNNPEHSSFFCVVKYVGNPEEMPTGVTPTDPYEHIHELWVNGTAGVYGPIAEYAPPGPQTPTAEDNKQTAMQFLQDTDWTATDDVGNPQKANPYLVNQAEFFTYRSAVREIAVNPTAGIINWPVKPNEVWSS